MTQVKVSLENFNEPIWHGYVLWSTLERFNILVQLGFNETDSIIFSAG